VQGESDPGSIPSQELDKLLDKLPPAELDRALQRRVDAGKSRVEIQSALFSGPLPPPSLLEAYETISSGFAERIVLMAAFI
jgi:uncharacterized membrane protein